MSTDLIDRAYILSYFNIPYSYTEIYDYTFKEKFPSIFSHGKHLSPVLGLKGSKTFIHNLNGIKSYVNNWSFLKQIKLILDLE